LFRTRADSLDGLGLVATFTDNPPTARTLFGVAVAVNRARADRAGEALNLNNLGRVAFYEGNLDEARQIQEAAKIWAEQGNT